ncbi:MAG: hypothetical protein LBP28_06520 [Coriobacteriales bacterium]|jgi:phage-related tail protein|nr:hypothetical protein [Coriobacteriales bacterium]
MNRNSHTPKACQKKQESRITNTVINYSTMQKAFLQNDLAAMQQYWHGNSEISKVLSDLSEAIQADIATVTRAAEAKLDDLRQEAEKLPSTAKNTNGGARRCI